MVRKLFLLSMLALPACARLSASNSLSRLRGGGGLAFDGALFDFDGTLAQSEGLHRLAFSEVLGATISEEEWESCIGTSPAQVIAERLPEGETVEALLVRRLAVFERYLEEGKLDVTAGAADLLEYLGEQGVRCAIVSSGSRSYILKALQRLGLESYFEDIVAGDDDVMAEGCATHGKPHHKPHPFPYLHAATRLGLRPERCVVFEDSLSGIRSAQAAGMLVIAIKSPANAALPVIPEEEACPRTGIQPLMDLLDDFDSLDRRFLF